MGKKGILAVATVLVAVTLIAVWMRRRELTPVPVIEAGSPTVAAARATPAPELDSKEPHTSLRTAPVAEKEVPADPEFQRWLVEEARELDQVHVDGNVKKKQIQSVVAKMTNAQSRQLLKTITNPRAPASEKILSTFLLVEGGSRTQKELTDLILAPLQENPNFQAHSEEEMKGIREKSLRIMAIDGLFSRAQWEPSAREALARAARETQDPSIRAYAEDKLRQLQ